MYNSCPEEQPPSEGSLTCVGVLPCKCGKAEKQRKQPPNIQHELNVAKAALQETSAFSGDNMFDHLSEIIKRILDERPPNVVDYFEEFSRNLREQKFRHVDNFMETLFDEPRCLRRAMAIMNSLNLLPYPAEDFEFELDEVESNVTNVTTEKMNRPLLLAENVLLLQHYWSLCGFGFQHGEVFLLSFQMQKIQQHPAVESARFWGKMFGRGKCYYIAEVILVGSEIEKRKAQMKDEMRIRFTEQLEADDNDPVYNPDLIPGTRWQDWPEDELKQMKFKQRPAPVPDRRPKYDIPPEPVGSGTNRTTYFVCNFLTEDWVELPIATPKQIVVSRQISKYFTGDLGADIDSYPQFPGKEKHYLRATISRITAGTYISPAGYYKVKKTNTGNDEEEEEEEEEDLDEDGKANITNDAVLVTNKNYKPLPINELLKGENWIHVRPVILNQGRIIWFDEEKALRELEAKGEGEEEEEDEEEEEEGDETARTRPQPEVGPPLLTPITEDAYSEVSRAWGIRISFHHNLSNRVIIVSSNTWPGAFGFAHDNVVDNIYIGWGRKFAARNYSPPHIPPVQQEYPLGPEIMEILDPTAKQEEEWRIAHMKPEKPEPAADEEEEEEEKED